MAESMFRQLVAKANLSHQIQVDSAGTTDYEEGKPPYPGARQTMEQHGLPTAGLVAWPFPARLCVGRLHHLHG